MAILIMVEGKKSKQYAVLAYIKGVTEKLQRAFRKHNISLHAKIEILQVYIAIFC